MNEKNQHNQVHDNRQKNRKNQDNLHERTKGDVDTSIYYSQC